MGGVEGSKSKNLLGDIFVSQNDDFKRLDIHNRTLGYTVRMTPKGGGMYGARAYVWFNNLFLRRLGIHLDGVHTIGNKHRHYCFLPLWRLPLVPTWAQAYKTKVPRVDGGGAQARCMIVGDQLNSHFFAYQMGRSHAPYPGRPHHGHPLQNQRPPLLCVTDHSSGHTEEWESLTPTRGATPKHGKTLPGALTYFP